MMPLHLQLCRAAELEGSSRSLCARVSQSSDHCYLRDVGSGPISNKCWSPPLSPSAYQSVKTKAQCCFREIKKAPRPCLTPPTLLQKSLEAGQPTPWRLGVGGRLPLWWVCSTGPQRDTQHHRASLAGRQGDSCTAVPRRSRLRRGFIRTRHLHRKRQRRSGEGGHK